MDEIRATLDTGIAPAADLEARSAGLGVALAFVSVTDRELASHSYGATATGVGRVIETAIWDESQFDRSVFGGERDVECFEDVLRVISNGSFPKVGARENLTPGQLNQLRDAIIFCAHVRDGREIFVTLDTKGFVSGGRRQELESVYKTRIMTRKEFADYLASRAATYGR